MMRLDTIAVTLLLFAVGCSEKSRADTEHYIKQLEDDNNISYTKIINTRGAYITPMCYTKTMDLQTNRLSNPCYSCHTKGKVPNYYNDTHLQIAYNFPTEMMQNPYSNLFKDRSKPMASMSDQEILRYIRSSNYLDDKGEIIPAMGLPKAWEGYRPDCYFNFDKEGFDLDPQGEYTGWRAFRYYPFLGTFWPTNGSTDDVIIRLDRIFMQDLSKRFSKKIYSLNLAIVESLVKQKRIALPEAVDEQDHGVDLNGNGVMDETSTISPSIQSYVGLAKQYLEEKKIHLAPGLYPENTEFLHSVRYIDWNEKNEQIMLAERMKELRYAKKYTWKRYGEIERAAKSEFLEAATLDSNEAQLVLYPGNYEEGLRNEIGWRYQGFIEDKNGRLRPQTHEETISCMGCHSHLGATTDSTFAFGRKLEGLHKDQENYGWGHWSQNGLSGLNEPQVEYQNYVKEYEYSFYLHNNHSGNEYRSNDEVQKKFFDLNGSIKQKMINALHDDISLLLFPSNARAIALNKAYRIIVKEQSYIYGKEVVIKPMENVFKRVKEGQLTGVKEPVIRP